MLEVLLVSSVLLWIGFLFTMFLLLGAIRRINTMGTARAGVILSDGLRVGDKAPEFIAETLQGDRVTLSTYFGQAVAFIFIMPGCTPCKEALPSYERIRDSVKRSGIEFVLVSSGNASETEDIVKTFHLRVPVLVAPRGVNSFMDDYKVRGAPSYCLVDPNGYVRSVGVPSTDPNEWKMLATAWNVNRNSRQEHVTEGGN